MNDWRKQWRRREAIVVALDIHLRDLFRETSSTSVESEYEYRDENGMLSYVVERRPSKRFSQRRPDGVGGWVWNLKGIVPLPYRLPELIAADPIDRVFIVEGEKDVDTLWSRGFVATCNSGGAGKWRDTHSRHLAGRRVVVLPDNDGPGQDHARKVARSLAGIAAEVRIVDLPGLPVKGDVSDWLAASHTSAELVKLSAAPVETISYDNEFVYASDYDEPEPQRWVVDDWIPEGFATILFAPGGSSKSFLCQYMAMRIVLGMKIFDGTSSRVRSSSLTASSIANRGCAADTCLPAGWACNGFRAASSIGVSILLLLNARPGMMSWLLSGERSRFSSSSTRSLRACQGRIRTVSMTSRPG